MVPKSYYLANKNGSPRYDQEREGKHKNKIIGSPKLYKIQIIQLCQNANLLRREYYQCN